MRPLQRWFRISSTVALVLSLRTYAVATNGENWGPWGMHMMWGSWGVGMMIMMFVFWVAIIVAVIFLIRWLATSGHNERQPTGRADLESPLDILKKRYARGDISKQEFDEIRRDL